MRSITKNKPGGIFLVPPAPTVAITVTLHPQKIYKELKCVFGLGEIFYTVTRKCQIKVGVIEGLDFQKLRSNFERAPE